MQAVRTPKPHPRKGEPGYAKYCEYQADYQKRRRHRDPEFAAKCRARVRDHRLRNLERLRAKEREKYWEDIELTRKKNKEKHSRKILRDIEAKRKV